MSVHAFVEIALAFASLRAEDQSTNERLDNATDVLRDMAAAPPDKGIPRHLFADSACAVIIPSVKKTGFLTGGKYGRGFACCKVNGRWSAPAGVRIEGGSFGLQADGATSDVILLIRNEAGMNKLLSDKFTLGGEAAAGTEILSWSRSNGVFRGISLHGSTLRPDDDANWSLYKSKVTNPEILSGKISAPSQADPLLKLLRDFSGSAPQKRAKTQFLIEPGRSAHRN